SMKLLTYIERIYSSDSPANLGILLDTGIVPLRSLNASDRNLPATMLDLLELGEAGMQEVSKALEAYLREGGKGELSLDQVQLLAPLPNPGSCRDAYAFRQHVETSRRNRGLDMIP